MWENKATRISLLVFLIILPILVGTFYRSMIDGLRKTFWYPSEIVLAAGGEGGRYRPLGDHVTAELEAEDLVSRTRVRSTAGSLENIRLLQAGEVHFALYQPGTSEILAEDESFEQVTFVANLYSQPVHFVVRAGSGITRIVDLRQESGELGETGKRRVQVGVKNSGDYAASLMLLEEYGVGREEIEELHLEYSELEAAFVAGEVDAALITVGINASIFHDLFASGHCRLLSLENTEAATWNRLAMSEFKIPRGLYGSEPTKDVSTVALSAQLLARKDLPAGLVKEVTGLVMKEEFLRENKLREVYLRPAFAQERPSFTVHAGARSFYAHGFDIQIFEAIDALYSLIGSICIAAFVLFKWCREKAERKKEHRLDEYVQALLNIEHRQMTLDATSGPDDLKELQALLDEVTRLRQEALKELTAHELNEDPAADSFVEMCHALSNKINAKITRQRFDQGIARLAGIVEKALGGGNLDEKTAGGG